MTRTYINIENVIRLFAGKIVQVSNVLIVNFSVKLFLVYIVPIFIPRVRLGMFTLGSHLFPRVWLVTFVAGPKFLSRVGIVALWQRINHGNVDFLRKNELSWETPSLVHLYLEVDFTRPEIVEGNVRSTRELFGVVCIVRILFILWLLSFRGLNFSELLRSSLGCLQEGGFGKDWNEVILRGPIPFHLYLELKFNFRCFRSLG